LVVPLSTPQHATLCALASAILDGAPPADETISQLVDRCAARAASLPPHRQALVATAVDVLGAPATVLLAIQRFRQFADLAPVDQRRCMAAWTDSSLPPLRAAWQTVRRLVLSVHYARPDVAAAIGYGGPFRTRSVLRPWEGPLPDGASLAALGVLLEREDVRADLAAKAASNPILLGELRMIADREGGKAPGVAAVLAELEASREPSA
jgi:hypothetical protein